MTHFTTRKLSFDAVLCAMCAVLGGLSLDFGNLKLTFESVPILIGALLFGPMDGMAIGGIGTLIYQLLRYGVSVTTPLWILPYVLCGLVTGLYAAGKKFSLNCSQMLRIVIGAELMVTALNTGVLYLDSKIYGYYSFAYIFGTLLLRVVICVAKAAVYALALPSVLRPVEQAFSKKRNQA